jgi:ferredoxin
MSSGEIARCTPSYHSILELAEACDIPVRWSCRTGVCHNCESGLVSGEVAYGRSHSTSPLRATSSCAARSRFATSSSTCDVWPHVEEEAAQTRAKPKRGITNATSIAVVKSSRTTRDRRRATRRTRADTWGSLRGSGPRARCCRRVLLQRCQASVAIRKHCLARGGLRKI